MWHETNKGKGTGWKKKKDGGGFNCNELKCVCKDFNSPFTDLENISLHFAQHTLQLCNLQLTQCLNHRLASSITSAKGHRERGTFHCLSRCCNGIPIKPNQKNYTVLVNTMIFPGYTQFIVFSLQISFFFHRRKIKKGELDRLCLLNCTRCGLRSEGRWRTATGQKRKAQCA